MTVFEMVDAEYSRIVDSGKEEALNFFRWAIAQPGFEAWVKKYSDYLHSVNDFKTLSFQVDNSNVKE